MDPLRLCIALTPLAIYLLLMARVNSGRRPRILNTVRDAAALGLGVMGMAVAGPMALFLPESAAARFGWLSWVLMIVLYLLALALIVLSIRPRLVIYNITAHDLRPVLATVVQDMDNQSRWAGNSIVMPQCGIHLHMDISQSMRNVQLVSSGSEQDYPNWMKLERNLRNALRRETFATTSKFANQNGILFLLLAFMLTFIVGKSLIQEQATIVHSLREMLRL